MLEKFAVWMNESIQEYVVNFHNSDREVFVYSTGSVGEMRRLLDDTVKIFYGSNLHRLHFQEALDDWLELAPTPRSDEKQWNFDILIGPQQHDPETLPEDLGECTWEFNPEEIAAIVHWRNRVFPQDTVMQFIEVPRESSKVVDLLSLIPF